MAQSSRTVVNRSTKIPLATRWENLRMDTDSGSKNFEVLGKEHKRAHSASHALDGTQFFLQRRYCPVLPHQAHLDDTSATNVLLFTTVLLFTLRQCTKPGKSLHQQPPGTEGCIRYHAGVTTLLGLKNSSHRCGICVILTEGVVSSVTLFY